MYNGFMMEQPWNKVNLQANELFLKELWVAFDTFRDLIGAENNESV
jgi:hypothetical protein